MPIKRLLTGIQYCLGLILIVCLPIGEWWSVSAAAICGLCLYLIPIWQKSQVSGGDFEKALGARLISDVQTLLTYGLAGIVVCCGFCILRWFGRWLWDLFAGYSYHTREMLVLLVFAVLLGTFLLVGGLLDPVLRRWDRRLAQREREVYEREHEESERVREKQNRTKVIEQR